MEEESLPSSWTNKLSLYRLPLTILVVGLLVTLVGIRIYTYSQQTPVEFISQEITANQEKIDLTVHIDGAVEKPGVYSLNADSRVQDVLIYAGGLSAAADRQWVAKQLNLAQKVSDGMKIYIPF